MLTDNNTPFSAIGFEQWHRDGGTMACVVVRGSVVFGKTRTEAAETQEIVLADSFDGDPQTGPLITPNDLVPYKPHADVTFLGALYGKNGAPRRL